MECFSPRSVSFVRYSPETYCVPRSVLSRVRLNTDYDEVCVKPRIRRDGLCRRGLLARSIEIDPNTIESLARQGGFVAYENYDQIVRPVHDSLADYLAAMAVDKSLIALPESVTENDTSKCSF